MSVSGSTVLPREPMRTIRVAEVKPPAEEEVQPNPWKDATDEEWQDWRWQLRNRITKAEQLKLLLNLNEEEVAAIDASKGKMATAAKKNSTGWGTPPILSRIMVKGMKSRASP